MCKSALVSLVGAVLVVLPAEELLAEHAENLAGELLEHEPHPNVEDLLAQREAVAFAELLERDADAVHAF